jgi:hypothetical protein
MKIRIKLRDEQILTMLVPIDVCFLMVCNSICVGVVGIATGYGLDGSGIESWWGAIFCTCPDCLWDPPSLLYNVYRVFSGGKEWPGRDADPSPPSSAMVMNE